MQRILSTPRLAKAATGLTAAEFETLAQVFGALWAKPLRRRTAEGISRQRQLGGGRAGRLSDPRHKLAFILFYFRVYPTQDVMGLFSGLSQPQVCAWVHRLTPLLQAALGRELHLPTRTPARLYQVLARLPGPGLHPGRHRTPGAPSAGRTGPAGALQRAAPNPHREERAHRGRAKSKDVERDPAGAGP